MHPPDFIQQFIELRAAAIPYAKLQRAVAVLSDHYRSGKATSALPLTAEERLAAYLVSRFPATYAAAFHVLRQAALSLDTGRVLDLGAGAGAATIAAMQIFPDLGPITLIETDAGFRGAGKELLPQGEWLETDLRRPGPLPPSELVLASYCLGELPASERTTLVGRAWQAAGTALVLIEPGSPNGFAIIRQARTQLIGLGARMVAPCPGEGACPVPEGDWCHFAQRIERSALHRRMKHGTLSYEDEKFSYIVFSRVPAATPAGRIIRRPGHHPGLIEITVCRGEAVVHERVTKRDREAFRSARKAVWGDKWA